MSKITIVAHITAKPDKGEFVKAQLEKLIDITRSEEGCLQYDLHQDNENPVHFMFYENWESRELWRHHMNSQHLKDYVSAVERAVELSRQARSVLATGSGPSTIICPGSKADRGPDAGFST